MNLVFLDSYAMNPGDMDLSAFRTFGAVTDYPRTAPEDVVARSKDAEILLINKVKLSAEILAQLPQLRMICVTATGYNIVDTKAASRLGIVVCNVPDYSSQSVAQMVFAFLLHITNHVAFYAAENRKGRWTASPDFCFQQDATIELSGKVMGIVGMGHIGVAVSRIALALGMHVWAVSSKSADRLPAGVLKKTLAEVLRGADVVSLHCPQTAETVKMMNKDTLSQMKPSAILINTARGGLIDEEAVAKALRARRLAAFAADVLTAEPPGKDCPLLTAPHAYLTPHIAWASYEARQRLVRICVDNVRAFIEGKPIHVVGK
jgi:glycerate dehydrogenase